MTQRVRINLGERLLQLELRDEAAEEAEVLAQVDLDGDVQAWFEFLLLTRVLA